MGKYSIGEDIYGYASLAVLNYRYIIVRNGSKIEIYNKTEHVFGNDIIEELCQEILHNEIISLLESTRGLSSQVLLNMFYGGYILSIIHYNKIDLLDLEYIKPGLHISVAVSSERIKMSEADIGFWSLLGYCLRKANYNLLRRISENYGFESSSEYILIPSWRNTLTIISKDGNGVLNALESIKLNKAYKNIMIDNNGIRHIIKFNDMNKGI